MQWFDEISRRRTGTGFGANPISYDGVMAWARLTRTRPSAMEVEWIMALDDTRMAAAAADQQSKSRGKPLRGKVK